MPRRLASPPAGAAGIAAAIVTPGRLATVLQTDIGTAKIVPDTSTEVLAGAVTGVGAGGGVGVADAKATNPRRCVEDDQQVQLLFGRFLCSLLAGRIFADLLSLRHVVMQEQGLMGFTTK